MNAMQRSQDDWVSSVVLFSSWFYVFFAKTTRQPNSVQMNQHHLLQEILLNTLSLQQSCSEHQPCRCPSWVAGFSKKKLPGRHDNELYEIVWNFMKLCEIVWSVKLLINRNLQMLMQMLTFTRWWWALKGPHLVMDKVTGFAGKN